VLSPQTKITRKSMLILTAVLAVEMLGTIGLYAHQRSRLDVLAKTYADQSRQLAQATRLGDMLTQAQGQLGKDKTQLGQLELALPTKEFIPTLLIQLQQLAVATDNGIISLKPTFVPSTPPPAPASANGTSANGVSAPAPGTTAAPAPAAPAGGAPAAGGPPAPPPNPYDIYKVEMDIQGQYNHIMAFLMELTRFPKIVSVDDFQIREQSPGAGHQSLVQATVKFSAYVIKGSK
jgi:Tfp pilus assembly protein PilO